MNPEPLERDLLLRDSGELSPERLQDLEDLLRQNPDARHYAEQFQNLTHTLKTHGNQRPPPLHGQTRARILAAAPQPTPGLLHLLRPALAAAAVLALLLILPQKFRTPTPSTVSPTLAETQPPSATFSHEDPLLTELDLLALDLLDIHETAWFDFNGTAHSLWDDFDLLEDSI